MKPGWFIRRHFIFYLLASPIWEGHPVFLRASPDDAGETCPFYRHGSMPIVDTLAAVAVSSSQFYLVGMASKAFQTYS